MQLLSCLYSKQRNFLLWLWLGNDASKTCYIFHSFFGPYWSINYWHIVVVAMLVSTSVVAQSCIQLIMKRVWSCLNWHVMSYLSFVSLCVNFVALAHVDVWLHFHIWSSSYLSIWWRWFFYIQWYKMGFQFYT